MSGKMDWRRAHYPRRAENTEHIFGSNIELKNGARTPTIPKDRLAKRADRAMDKWLKRLSPAQRKALDEI